MIKHKLLSLFLLLTSSCAAPDNMIEESGRAELTSSQLTDYGQKTGVVIFGVKNDHAPKDFLGMSENFNAAWMYYDKGSNVFQVPGYNTILSAGFDTACNNSLFHNHHCDRVKYHAFQLDEGTYSLAYIESTFYFYNIGGFSQVKIIRTHYGESRSFAPDTSPNVNAPHFNVVAGTVTYVGDLNFSYFPTLEKYRSIITITNGDTRDGAAQFAKSMGFSTPLENEIWGEPNGLSSLTVFPSKLQ